MIILIILNILFITLLIKDIFGLTDTEVSSEEYRRGNPAKV